MTTEYYARSGDKRRNVPPQPYREHLLGTRERCERYLNETLRYSRKGEKFDTFFRDGVLLAAEYHDLGKLADVNQRILRGFDRFASLPYPHDDAGSALLLKRAASESFSSILIFSHHAGLPDLFAEQNRQTFAFRRFNKEQAKEPAAANARLDAWRKIHRAVVDDVFPTLENRSCDKLKGLILRLALSCLADADFGDAASWSNRETDAEASPPQERWAERLAALDAFVARLGAGSKRDRDRRDVYRVCRERSFDDGPIETCGAPVGSGKTTAVMARLLRLALQNDLRRLFVVLPYTNIIQQTVDVYRKALVLPGENPEEIVAENHCRADFSDPALGTLSTRWRAPIVVTTSVQFFETLGSARPSRLRKLRELPGSAIFIDEAHAAAPIALWPQEWKWFESLAKDWSCRIVLGSGTLRKYWENKELLKTTPRSVPEILPVERALQLQKRENRRVRFARDRIAWNMQTLKERLLADSGGSKLIVLNTVYSAANVAAELRAAGADVLHLSSALAPRDRANTLTQIQRRLNPNDSEYRDDWILVATSCVEAGVDFSFVKGYRECCSAANLLQIGGRVNRHCERSQPGLVVSFRLAAEKDFETVRDHPNSEILDKLFDDNRFNDDYSIETILNEELAQLVETTRLDQVRLLDAENARNYSKVAELCKVVDKESSAAIIDDELAKRLAAGEKVGFREIQRVSVPVRNERLSKLGVEAIDRAEGLYRWTLEYDPTFLGYMTDEARRLLRR